MTILICLFELIWLLYGCYMVVILYGLVNVTDIVLGSSFLFQSPVIPPVGMIFG